MFSSSLEPSNETSLTDNVPHETRASILGFLAAEEVYSDVEGMFLSAASCKSAVGVRLSGFRGRSTAAFCAFLRLALPSLLLHTEICKEKPTQCADFKAKQRLALCIV